MSNETPNTNGEISNINKETSSNTENQDKKQANKVLYITLGIILVIIVSLFTNGFGYFNTGNVILNVSESNLTIGNSPVLGNPDAPVTIYEFSDFSCPFCAAADGKQQPYIDSLKASNPGWEAPIPNIIKDYVNTGKVKLVFKYFPTHEKGKPAHLVSLSLADQNNTLFWQFHELAFQNQADTGDLFKMESLAESIGGNITKIKADISSGKYEFQLLEETSLATSLGIKGTPAFIINGELISGARSYSDFKKVIDSKLQSI